ncbi:MAG: hypothetical protein VXY56_07760 [Pseudomonadota bacterium]|nr:hypothetical protein [Pseudomonadota bacterium]
MDAFEIGMLLCVCVLGCVVYAYRWELLLWLVHKPRVVEQGEGRVMRRPVVLKKDDVIDEDDDDESYGVDDDESDASSTERAIRRNLDEGERLVHEHE